MGIVQEGVEEVCRNGVAGLCKGNGLHQETGMGGADAAGRKGLAIEPDPCLLHGWRIGAAGQQGGGGEHGVQQKVERRCRAGLLQQ